MIIPACGKTEYTSLAIQSVRRNTDEPCKIVVVESSSYAVWGPEPDAEIIRIDQFYSFSDSVNLALKHANAADFEYVVLLNNDAVVGKGWFDSMRAALDDGYCVVGPVTNLCGHGDQIVHPALNYTVPADVVHEEIDRFVATLESGRIPVFAVVGFCMAFKSSLIGRIGCLDTRFRPGNFEDNDWCLRASEVSSKGCCVCQDSFVWHFGSATFRETDSFEEAMTVNKNRFERKWLGKGETPKRHNSFLYRTHRPWIRLLPLKGPPDDSEESRRLMAANVEMWHRGFCSPKEVVEEEAIEVPLDTAALPESRSDEFYELCDGIEYDVLTGMAEVQNLSKADLSVCMIVKDEESVIGRCLDSVSSLAKQIVVVDTGSTDATVAIAKKYGVEIYHHFQDGSFNFSVARNHSLSKATCDWILVMDADEILLPDAVETIRRIANSGVEAAYRVSTRLYQTNPKIEGLIPNDGVHPGTSDYCGFIVSTKVRLWPQRRGLEFRNEVHETVEQSAIEADLPFRQCNAVVHHFGGRSLAEKDELYAELGYEKAKNEPCYRTYRELGLQLYRMSRQDEAVAALRKALEFEPGDIECNVLIGACMSQLGENDSEAMDQAESYYLVALEKERTSELANRYYATFLNRRGRFKEAYWHYRKVAPRAVQAKDVKTLCDFAYACQHLHQPDEAIEMLEAALRTNPEYVRKTGMMECAYHMSGVMAGKNGDMAKATRQFRRALEIKPDFEEAKHNLAIAEHWITADSL